MGLRGYACMSTVQTMGREYDRRLSCGVDEVVGRA